jgi:hypothetical protein
VTSYYISNEEKTFYLDNFKPIISAVIVVRGLKALLDIYLGLEFVSLTGYFVKMKIHAMNARG